MALRIFHVDHVLTGDAPAIADGAVVVDESGAIREVGPAQEVLPKHAGTAERVRGVAFPGLVNAHTHLELSALHGKVPGGSGFVPWVESLLSVRLEHTPEDDVAAIDRAVTDLERFATVAVGEVTNSLAAVGALARRGIGGWAFHEVFGQDREAVLRRVRALRDEIEERHATWPTRDLGYAPAAHTLYTTHQDAVLALVDAATSRELRTTVHLAEHAAERLAIERGDGPAVAWFEKRTNSKPTWPKSPLFDHAEAAGVLRPAILLVHLTDARPDELLRVAASGASVVLCPRSNQYIEGRLPPLRDVFEAGLSPALGTDSLASNTSLDVLAEARTLHDHFPDLPAWRLVMMATSNGARALGRADLGVLAPGTRPGLYAVEGEVTGDPAAYLLAHVDSPRRVLASRHPESRS